MENINYSETSDMYCYDGSEMRFCFSDENVTTVDRDDVKKAYPYCESKFLFRHNN